jgi:hypothetical protein
MAAHVFITSARVQRPSLAKLLAVLIIVLSVSGTGLAAFMLTRASVVTRPVVSHASPKLVRPQLTSTHRPPRHQPR